MAMEDMRELISRLGQMSAADRAALGRSAAGSTSGTNPLGLRFAVRDRVLDVASGKAGVIQLAERDPQTRYERYRVALSDARVVFRTEKELEPLAAAATVAP